MTGNPLARQPALLRRSITTLWQALNWSRLVVVNGLFLVLILFFIAALLTDRTPRVPDGAALVLELNGRIVEQLAYEPPAMLLVRRGVDDSRRDEILLQDILDALDIAASDPRVQVAVLKLEGLRPSGLSKLQAVGQALGRVRESGKPVIVHGEHYTQSQYYLAAYADEVYLDPMGAVLLQGFGVYRTYFRSALERLRIQVHAFQVGTYKSALEPYLRDDMSQADRQATLAWLDALWNAYCGGVAEQRHMPADAVHGFADSLAAHVDATQGDLARLALQRGLVDSLADRRQVEQRLIELTGEQNGDYRQIGFRAYLQANQDRTQWSSGPRDARVGLITGRGVILGGDQQAGRIGADTVSRLLRQAREDATIRAVVLRLDSGGGSALAAETLRREVLLTREAGKPVVASLSSVAASGAYWIASAADAIWAAPTTLTGSIGIFGAVPSFEHTLDALGIHVDGVGTTSMAAAFDPRQEIDPATARIMQQTVEHGYARFLQVVGAGRNMPPDEVDAIGQGRVWDAVTARELGLVDHLGELDDAIAAAAEFADLERFRVIRLQPVPGTRERIMRWLTGLASGFLAPQDDTWLHGVRQAVAQLTPLVLLDDPRGLYAWCVGCSILH